jgi:hypothetical protein
MPPETTGAFTLTLDADEHSTLHEILTNYLSDLRMEIADTDSIEFKNGLRLRKEVILSLLGKLEPQTG